MSKFCPILKRKVVYLDCNECEDKALCKELCKKPVATSESKITVNSKDPTQKFGCSETET